MKGNFLWYVFILIFLLVAVRFYIGFTKGVTAVAGGGSTIIHDLTGAGLNYPASGGAAKPNGVA